MTVLFTRILLGIAADLGEQGKAMLPDLYATSCVNVPNSGAISNMGRVRLGLHPAFPLIGLTPETRSSSRVHRFQTRCRIPVLIWPNYRFADDAGNDPDTIKTRVPLGHFVRISGNFGHWSVTSIWASPLDRSNHLVHGVSDGSNRHEANSFRPFGAIPALDSGIRRPVC